MLAGVVVEFPAGCDTGAGTGGIAEKLVLVSDISEREESVSCEDDGEAAGEVARERGELSVALVRV